MLRITIPGREMFDERTNEFITTKEYNVQLAHSLVSLSKWESFYLKPFLTKEEKTKEEILTYIKCMTTTQNVPDEAYSNLTKKNLEEITAYIEHPKTATTFTVAERRPNKEVMTSELIYYSMIAYGIPWECQRWHLNRLLTLINVCSIKNEPAKKMSKSELIARNRHLNRARKKRLNTRG